MSNEGNLAFTMLKEIGEVILLGVEGARIVQVRPERVEYIDSNASELLIFKSVQRDGRG